ncbi:MAG: phosphopyruvate hydratase [Candidatus Iainarchaeum archaeon]|uniref:Enolase n=1 Tax=Candidatus Iainarchaeum sp. TaxID=3101447 RepID=A0A497JHF0_9ARCH|nr:MAG: phosphopyruvate hydratase [Candidatus Diapherotrites archaeon]
MIEGIRARQILDSRGNPTIECEIRTVKGTVRAAVPSGASTGSFEAIELRDNEKAFRGKGVLKAVQNINTIIAPKLTGKDPIKQRELDELMLKLDNTQNKSKLGANAIVAVSLAIARAGSLIKDKQLFEYIAELSGAKEVFLPVPQMNVLNGGKHAGLKNDIQEHMIVPLKFESYSEALQAGCEVYYFLKDILKQKFGARAALVGDEGGFVPPIETTRERLELMEKAIDEAGYKGKVLIALDSAASEFFYENTYVLGEEELSSGEMIDFYNELIKSFAIFSIEDALAEEDWQGWQELTKKLGNKVQIVGDDLLVTNAERIKKAIELQACNALLLKVNQIGTLSEAIDAAKLAFQNNWQVVVSHRSGETCDPFIASLVVGLGAKQCKFGAPARSERNSKYNHLLRIEETLKEQGKARYAGKFL